MLEIGKRIKARRLHLKISAEELAPMVGLSAATIYRYENGDIKKVNTTKLQPFAKALNTTEAYLMGWVDDPEYKLESVTDTPVQTDILYISKPRENMESDEVRRFLHELIDRLHDDDLVFMKDFSMRMVRKDDDQ